MTPRGTAATRRDAGAAGGAGPRAARHPRHAVGRVDPAAEGMAIDSALEAGVPLVIANMLHLPPYPATVVLVGAANATLPHEEALDEVRGTAARAASLGVKTELLRVRPDIRSARCSRSWSSGTPGCSCSAPTARACAGCATAPPSGGCGGTRRAWCGSRPTADASTPVAVDSDRRLRYELAT